MGPFGCRFLWYIFFDFTPIISPLTWSPLIVSLFYLCSQWPFIPQHYAFLPKIVFLTLKVFTLHRVFHNPVKLCVSCLDMITSTGAHNAFPPHPAILGILIFSSQLSHNPSGTCPRPDLAQWYSMRLDLLHFHFCSEGKNRFISEGLLSYLFCTCVQWHQDLLDPIIQSCYFGLCCVGYSLLREVWDLYRVHFSKFVSHLAWYVLQMCCNLHLIHGL